MTTTDFTHLDIDMPTKHDNGTTRSRGNAFAAAYIVRSGKTYTAPRKTGPKKLLNSAGRPQATLAPAVMNNISIAPSKTVEQVAAAVIRSSQINRPAKASKKVAV